MTTVRQLLAALDKYTTRHSLKLRGEFPITLPRSTFCHQHRRKRCALLDPLRYQTTWIRYDSNLHKFFPNDLLNIGRKFKLFPLMWLHFSEIELWNYLQQMFILISLDDRTGKILHDEMQWILLKAKFCKIIED